MKGVVQLLDLPDELLLNILRKVDCQALLLCSMIDIGNDRLKQLVFDKCHSIDLSSYCYQAKRRFLQDQFYSYVMPPICHDIRSLTITHHHISSMKTFIDQNCNGTLPNLIHLKFLLGLTHSKTGIPFTIGNQSLLNFCQMLFFIVLNPFPLS